MVPSSRVVRIPGRSTQTSSSSQDLTSKLQWIGEDAFAGHCFHPRCGSGNRTSCVSPRCRRYEWSPWTSNIVPVTVLPSSTLTRCSDSLPNASVRRLAGEFLCPCVMWGSTCRGVSLHLCPEHAWMLMQATCTGSLAFMLLVATHTTKGNCVWHQVLRFSQGWPCDGYCCGVLGVLMPLSASR